MKDWSRQFERFFWRVGSFLGVSIVVVLGTAALYVLLAIVGAAGTADWTAPYPTPRSFLRGIGRFAAGGLAIIGAISIPAALCATWKTLRRKRPRASAR